MRIIISLAALLALAGGGNGSRLALQSAGG
jgi:hypothetical protein